MSTLVERAEALAIDVLTLPAPGTGVIWNGDSLDPPVIPAKAGIQSDDSAFPKVCGVDSRFRGNDRGSGMTGAPK
jgi:hypothetical protein